MYQKVLEINPLDDDAREGASDLSLEYHQHCKQMLDLARQKEWSPIEYSCQQDIDIGPFNMQFLSIVGHVLITQNKFDIAACVYEKMLAINPNYLEALTGLGKALTETRELEKAEKTYQKVLSIDPSSVDALISLGGVLMRESKWELAESVYRKALKRNPESVLALIGIANVLVEQRQLHEAERKYLEALRFDPARVLALKGLVSVLMEKQLWGKAELMCRRICMVTPDCSETRGKLGVALGKQGKCLENGELSLPGIIILRGPDSECAFSEELKAYLESGETIAIVGDGIHLLSKKELIKEQYKFVQASKVCILAHGVREGPDKSTHAIRLFHDISNTKGVLSFIDGLIKSPMEVLIDSCYGGLAAKYVDQLKTGSILICTSSPSGTGVSCNQPWGEFRLASKKSAIEKFYEEMHCVIKTITFSTAPHSKSYISKSYIHNPFGGKILPDEEATKWIINAQKEFSSFAAEASQPIKPLIVPPPNTLDVPIGNVVNVFIKHLIGTGFFDAETCKQLCYTRGINAILPPNAGSALHVCLHFPGKGVESIRVLLKANADVNALDVYGTTPLFQAIKNKSDLEIIQLLISSNADVNALDVYGTTPLVCAIKTNPDLKIIQLLISSSAKINCFTKVCPPCVFCAAYLNNKEVVHMLLAAGANPRNMHFGFGAKAIKSNDFSKAEKHYVEAFSRDSAGKSKYGLNGLGPVFAQHYFDFAKVLIQQNKLSEAYRLYRLCLYAKSGGDVSNLFVYEVDYIEPSLLAMPPLDPRFALVPFLGQSPAPTMLEWTAPRTNIYTSTRPTGMYLTSYPGRASDSSFEERDPQASQGPHNPLNWSLLIYRISIGFKVTDLALDTAKTCIEPSSSNFKQLGLNAVHTISLISSGSMIPSCATAIVMANIAHTNGVFEAVTYGLISLAFMAFKPILIYSGIPYVGTIYALGMAGYLGYKVTTKAYEFYQEMHSKNHNIKAGAFVSLARKDHLTQEELIERDGEGFGRKLDSYIYAPLRAAKLALIEQVILNKLSVESATEQLQTLQKSIPSSGYDVCRSESVSEFGEQKMLCSHRLTEAIHSISILGDGSVEGVDVVA